MKILLKTALLAILLTACGNKNGSATGVVAADSTVTDSISVQTDESNYSKTPVDLNAIKPYLAKEREMREELIKLLKRSTPEQADSIYLEANYDFKKTVEFDSLCSKTYMLEDRCSGWGELLPQDSVAIKLLQKAGCVFNDIGEGYVRLETEQYYYYNIFKPYLSAEVEKYAQLRSDNNTLLSADAGLCVSLDTLYSRCLNWENYLQEYPHSKSRSAIGEEYKTYMSNLLFCTMDNTPTFESVGDDSDNKKISDYMLEKIRPLKRIGRGTKTNNIILKYLAGLNGQEYRYSEDFEKQIMDLCNWIDKPE